MKKVFLLLGVSLLSFASCKKSHHTKQGEITVNTAKLSTASSIFMKNNAAEFSKGNPSDAKSNYVFELGDYNNDGEVDLYAIKKYNTETHATEIHVLNGANNFKSSLLKTQTVLKDKQANYKFELGDYNNDRKVDLYAIKRDEDKVNYAEIHVLNGAKNYRSSLLKTQTVLNKVDSNYEFELGDYNNDGKVDLYTFKKQNLETNYIEIHVLNGASNFTSSLLKMETQLSEYGYEFNLRDYDNDGKVDLYALKKGSEKANFAEISVLSGASNYRKSLFKTEAVFNKADSNYMFKLGDNYIKSNIRTIKKQNRGTRLTTI